MRGPESLSVIDEEPGAPHAPRYVHANEISATSLSSEIRWIGPGFWMVPSLALIFVSLIYPPTWYTDALGDTNFVFLNARTFAFTLLCVLSIIAGMLAVRRIAPPGPLRYDPRESEPMLTDVAMSVALLLGNLYVLRIIQQSGLFSSFLETARGNAHFGRHFEATLQTLEPAGVSSISLASVAFLPWLYHVRLSARNRITLRDKILLAGLFWSLFLTYAATVAPLGRRNELLRPILGVFLVWFFHQCVRGTMTRKRILAVLTAFLAFGVSLFSVVWIARTGGFSNEVDANEFSTEIIGYSIAPYNQQAAIIDGAMKVPGTGKGYNWSQWLWKFPVLQNYIDAEEVLGELPPYGVYERRDLLEANGFEPRFTALSAFGNSFVDFGWLGFVPFLAYGAIGACTWMSFLRGRPMGIILYPIFAYSILEWRANLLFPPRYLGQILIILAAVAIGRRCERAMRRR